MSFFKKSKAEEKREPKSDVKPPDEKVPPLPEKKSAVPPPPQVTSSKEDKLKSQGRGFLNRFQGSASDQENPLMQQFSTRIGKTVTVTGEISGGEDVLVEGKVNGDIFIMSKLSIGISGAVNGKIEAQEVRISGKSTGEILARQKLDIASTGDVDGQLKTPRIIVEEGARLKSKIETSKPAPKKLPIEKIIKNEEETTQKLEKSEQKKENAEPLKEEENTTGPRTIDTSQYKAQKIRSIDIGKNFDNKK